MLPPDAKKMEKALRDMGMGKMCDDAIEAINRGAEDAVGYATPIFVDAIKQMTVTDALKLCNRWQEFYYGVFPFKDFGKIERGIYACDK